jgi:hypothetical protein
MPRAVVRRVVVPRAVVPRVVVPRAVPPRAVVRGGVPESRWGRAAGPAEAVVARPVARPGARVVSR